MSNDNALPFDLPSVCRKKLSVGFDGGQLSSDAGVLLLRNVERRLGIAQRLSMCLKDKRDPDLILHTVEEAFSPGVELTSMRYRIIAVNLLGKKHSTKYWYQSSREEI